jgi:hypothetical protein
MNLSCLHIINLSLGRQSNAEFGLLPLLNKVKSSFIKNSFIFLCGVDLEVNSININRDSFVVLQGSFLNNVHNYLINVVLPVKVYVEGDTSFIILKGDFVKLLLLFYLQWVLLWIEKLLILCLL